MNIANNLPQVKELKKFILIFYTVACIGFAVPITRELFIWLTPLALLLNVFLLLVFDQNKNKPTAYITFLICFLVGFGVELIGVNTGILFGNYKYFEGLGFQLVNTPLIIGVNWLLLVYFSRNLIEKFTRSVFLQIVASSFIMVIYDVLLEQVAPLVRFWQFENGEVPLKNYFTWFIVAILLQVIVTLFGLKTENKLAKTLFATQVIFFVCLFLILR